MHLFARRTSGGSDAPSPGTARAGGRRARKGVRPEGSGASSALAGASTTGRSPPPRPGLPPDSREPATASTGRRPESPAPHAWERPLPGTGGGPRLRIFRPRRRAAARTVERARAGVASLPARGRGLRARPLKQFQPGLAHHPRAWPRALGPARQRHRSSPHQRKQPRDAHPSHGARAPAGRHAAAPSARRSRARRSAWCPPPALPLAGSGALRIRPARGAGAHGRSPDHGAGTGGTACIRRGTGPQGSAVIPPRAGETPGETAPAAGPARSAHSPAGRGASGAGCPPEGGPAAGRPGAPAGGASGPRGPEPHRRGMAVVGAAARAASRRTCRRAVRAGHWKDAGDDRSGPIRTRRVPTGALGRAPRPFPRAFACPCARCMSPVSAGITSAGTRRSKARFTVR